MQSMENRSSSGRIHCHITRFAEVTVVAVLALVLTGGTAWAQSITGTIVGTVMDPAKNVVPGAQVTIVNQETGTERSVKTGAAGGFVFASIMPGTYTVRVESAGFQRFESLNNILSANQRLSVGNIQLTIGAVTQSVSVTAEGGAVQTASSESSSVLTGNQISNITMRGRALTDYLLLIPGVNTNLGPSDATSGFMTVPSAGGTRNTMTTMAVDGAHGGDMGSPQLFQNPVSPDAVSEVRVLMNNYQAEYGRTGGMTVNVITKSGTREFHGSAYYYKRHEMFNANTFFNNRSGLAKQKYRYNTKGVTIGGPVAIPGVSNSLREKLFFFYNFDSTPSTSTPSTPSTTTMPTKAERLGDFSQSLNPGGSLIVVRDPTTNAPFANNIIPSDRINAQGQILLNVFSLPNQLDRSLTGGAYNNEYLNVVPNERPQHLFRIDYRPTSADSFYFRGLAYHAKSIGGSVTSWDFARNSFAATSKTAVAGWTRVLSPAMVNELTAGVRRQGETTTIDDNRGFRSTYDFTLGQFHPEINYFDLLPTVSFSGAGLQNLPSFGSWQAGRFPQIERDLVLYFQDAVTYVRGTHTFKAGVYWERDRITTGTGFGTTPFGAFNFGVNTDNPLDSRHPFANALLGDFQTYQESTWRTRPGSQAHNFAWYVQDSWKPMRNLTLELGFRGEYYTQWWQWDGQMTAWSLERWDPSQTPALFQPGCLGAAPCSGSKRVAVNPLTGATTSGSLIGAYVPNTGDPANGFVTSADQNYPHGFIESPLQLPEPRVGFALDVFGDGKTALRGGFGIVHELLRYEPTGAGPPIAYTPVIYYGSFNTMFGQEGYLSPSNVTSFNRYRKTPTVLNISLGVQQEIGFHTVLDVKYVSTLGRHLGSTSYINLYAPGTRFQTENIDPTTGKTASDIFLVPYPGQGRITYQDGAASSNYHSLQVSANRRFAGGFTFGLAYTFAKLLDYGGSGYRGTATIPQYYNARWWTYGPADIDQTHILTMNYTYAIPALSKVAPNPVVSAVFDHWAISGITSFSSGTPNNASLSLSDNADLLGGGDPWPSGSSPARAGRPNLIGDPAISNRGFAQMFDPTVFARPGAGDPGNMGRSLIRNGGINNWDLSLYKIFPLGSEQRHLQFRWEFYNLLNHTQFSGMNTTATFNSAGIMTNSRLGEATSARTGRVMQASLRIVF